MDLEMQALPTQPEANTPQAYAQPEGSEANVSLSADLSQFAATPATTEATTQQAYAQPQAQAQPQMTETEAKHWQKIANERLLENYRIQQELERLRTIPQAQQTAQQPIQNQNPYDANSDWQSWIRWEQNTAAKSAAQEAANATAQQIMGYAQQQAVLQQEAQWAMQHPGVDVNLVKAFAKSRGISQIDDAFMLMNMPNMLSSVQQQTQQQTFNQFSQPKQGAIPVRNAPGAPNAENTSLSFEKLLKAYTQNPSIENTWPEGLRQAFQNELFLRSGQR